MSDYQRHPASPSAWTPATGHGGDSVFTQRADVARVLRNTYALLSMTLLFSAAMVRRHEGIVMRAGRSTVTRIVRAPRRTAAGAALESERALLARLRGTGLPIWRASA